MAVTFVDVVTARAGSPAPAFDFVDRASTTTVSYAELDSLARAAGASLVERGLTGQRVLVLLPPGLDYVVTLLGCLYAGAVAVPLSPGLAVVPSGHGGSARVEAVVVDAAPAVAVVSPGAWVPGVVTLTPADLRTLPPSAWRRPELGPDSLAVLQYPAGSGGLRGIMVSHANLLASCRQVSRLFGGGPGAGVVSWLPPYQDVGLLTGILQPVYAGGRSTLLDPREFRTRPGRWLRLVEEREARISGGPDVALSLCADLPDSELAGLDLSGWDCAFTNACPSTVDRFVTRLAPYGLRRSAVSPCYWLPEATSLVAGRRSVTARSFDADSLAPGRSTRLRSPGVRVLDRGRSGGELDVVIVDPLTGTRCPDGTAGEIWVSGASVAVGYLGRPEASERTFCARLRGSAENYLRTGDLGFVHGGGLHVTDLAA